MGMELFEVDGARLTWRGGGETLVVEPWGRHSVRVRAALGADVLDTDWALLPPDDRAHDDARVVVGHETAILTNGAIRVVATASDFFDSQAGYVQFACRLAFYDADGRLLLQEGDDGGPSRRCGAAGCSCCPTGASTCRCGSRARASSST